MYLGGLSSYTLTLMVLTFVNMYGQFPSVGDYFLGLLEYYGYVFQSADMRISEGQWIVYKEEALDELVVADLFHPETNAASYTTKFPEIQEVMRRTYEDIKKGSIKDIFKIT